jgi:hypothetical protein
LISFKNKSANDDAALFDNGVIVVDEEVEEVILDSIINLNKKNNRTHSLDAFKIKTNCFVFYDEG